jgi:hypothetical protein
MKKQLLSILVLVISIQTNAQVGIGTATPSTSLQVVGEPTNTTVPDGVQAPSITLAQLDAKIASYGATQDGAIIYVSDVSVASSVSETAGITVKGFYYYDFGTNVWKALGGSSVSGGATLTLGQAHQGGLIFYLDASGEHGLIVSPQISGTYFSRVQSSVALGGITGAIFSGLYTGKLNTQIILRKQGSLDAANAATYAANLTVNYSEGGYTDWYLPSIYELSLVIENRSLYTTFAYDLVNNWYWSSTEVDSTNVYTLHSELNYSSVGPKAFGHSTRSVRLIRAF